MAGQNPGKSSLKISGIKDGRAENCKVYGVKGNVEIPSGSKVDVEIYILEGENARASGGEVAAVGGHLINQKGDEGRVLSSPGEGQSEKNFEHCGSGKTVALLIAGAGDDDAENEIFKKDMKAMEDLLTGDNVGVREEDIHKVYQKTERRTKDIIKNVIHEIADDLKVTEDRCLIVYYTGHFGENTFRVGGTGDEQDYRDEEFVDDLVKIPAKYVLFITDMCESASAKLGTKQKTEADRKPPNPPRVFDLYQSKTVKKKGDKEFKALKVVQWASSEDSEYSHFTDQSWFTRAIKDVITDPSSRGGAELRRDHPGPMYASVLKLHKYVCRQVDNLLNQHGMQGADIQNPKVKPENADEDYFDTFPPFAHIS